MDVFSNILFVSTGRDSDVSALERALRVAASNDAALTIVGVVSEFAPEVQALLAPVLSSEALAKLKSGPAQEHLDRLAQIAAPRRVSTELLHGTPAIEVIRRVVRNRHDLVVKAAEPMTGLRRMMFGHTDLQLVRKCPCPVWIEKPGTVTEYNSILAAVDPQPADPELHDPVREELNARVLELAAAMAEIENAGLHVVHAWSLEVAMGLQSRAGFSKDVVDQLTETWRREREVALNQLLGPFRSRVTGVHLMEGATADAVAKVAADHGVDLLVMGSVCRTGVAGLLIGNTAETMLSQAECSVLTVKPSGFVTPITVE